MGSHKMRLLLVSVFICMFVASVYASPSKQKENEKALKAIKDEKDLKKMEADKDVKKRKEDEDDDEDDDDGKDRDVEERRGWKKCQGLKGQEKRQCIKKIIEMWRAGKMKRLAGKIKKMCTKCDKACNGTNTTNGTNVSKVEVYLDERKKGKRPRPNKAQMCAECTKCCAMKPAECMSMLKEKR